MKVATKGQKPVWIDRPRGAIREARLNPEQPRPAALPVEPAIEKKRGFWSKIFGR